MSFIDELSKIASQMSNDVDYKHLNTKIKEQCDFLLSSINNGHNSSVVVNNTKISQSKAVTNAGSKDIKDHELCLKCNRKCLSRSVWCNRGKHWIHYNCEKLKSEMINILENNLDTNHYICSICDIDSIDDKQVLSVNSPTDTQVCDSINLPLVNMINEESFLEGNEIESDTSVKHIDKDQVIPKVTFAQSLLLEEFPRSCALCLELLNTDEQICEFCDQSYHIKCMGKENKICLGCEATHSQNSENLHLNIETSVKKVNSPRPTLVCVDKNITDKSKENQDKDNENSVLKQKELRQLELKLKKKEESLKLKELSVNEKLKEKTKLLDYLHQIEARNLELEQTIKTMNRKIIILEENQNNSSLRNEKSESGNLNSHRDNSEDLLVQVRNKVTKFIVDKIENELDKLSDNITESNDKSKDTQNHVYQQNVKDNSENQYSQHNWDYQNYYHQYPYYYDHHNSYYINNYGTVNESHSDSESRCDYENQWFQDTSPDNTQTVTHSNLIDVLASNNQVRTNCDSQKHWLFNFQLNLLNELHQNICGIGKAVDDKDPINPTNLPRGYGGTGILWRKDLDNFINPLDIGNDRICCVELLGSSKLLLVSVYLPCKGTPSDSLEFYNCIDQLHEIVQSYSDSHSIIIGGDFNENILSKIDTRRNKYLVDFLNENSLYTEENGITFVNCSGKGTSTIDFLLFKQDFKENVISMETMDNVATNVSDHFPVKAKVKYIINAKEKLKCSNSNILPSGKTPWKKIDKDAYKTLVENGLDNFSSSLENKYEVDIAFQNMNSLLFNSAKSCCPTPRKRYRKPKLKVMNEDISGAIAMKKKAFYQWKINGRSEDPRNELYIQKKETTYNLRKHCRKAVAMNRIDEREKIMEANIKNKNSFYRLIKKQRGRLSNHIDELSVGDTVYSTENNILSGWKHHFENLTKNSIHEHFDNKYQQKIEQEYIDIIDICRAMFQHQSITENEIVEALKLLNLNKSPDIFGVSTENLLYGGQSLIYHLKELLDNILADSGYGGKIGSISCCAPTCADDLAILSNCPYETQILIDMAFDFSKREAYLLQPAKSCVIQSKSRHHEKVNENFWNLGNSVLPTSNKATHIGICRTDDDSCKATIDENLKKARRTLYSLMGVGLYGENGLDPQTSMSIMNTYIIPIMFYGLEIVIPRGRCLETLNIQFKKFLKQLLSLPKTVADPAIYMISGMLPVEAQIDVKILTFYGNITRQGKNSIEWQLAERQLNVKSINSNSWFSLLRKIFLKYELNDPAQYLVNPISKYQWKREITSKVQKFWIEKILNQAKLYTSLRYLSLIYKPGQCHPIANTNTMNSREIIRIPTKLKIATGSYILQTVRAKFKSNTELSICKLCNETEETLPHFLLTCKSLEDIRKPILEDLINSCSEELAAFNMKGEHFDILQLIIDPFNYMTMLRNEKVFKVIQNIIDPKCRRLCYNLHCERYRLLQLDDIKKKKRK
ncbi:unnamed protein product [Mytilus edulis]|uniref:Phorbol-ester/DAG-type domain-containing protein n=1 Tax=Mytilus edulis TaxID=6550 RepID=A0A8S3TC06_MYTED|nr:unnamed protein product [Mytilus edulis]